MKKALVTGVTGQDGSYLTELLLAKGYEVHGVIRQPSLNSLNIRDARLHLHYGDLADTNIIRRLIYEIQPDEVYNLGAQSDVKASFDLPEYTANITGLGALRMLEAIKDFREQTGRDVKFYQASSSEMFGLASPPQNERTPFNPRSPYGEAKVFAHNATLGYRDSYGLFAVAGILFNHESPRRGETYVTRKISRGAARIKAGLDKKLYLGNLDARRDWGYAPEYVEAMWLMMQQSEPDIYVIGTGETHSVKDFLEAAFRHAGLGDWQRYVEVDPRYFRPVEAENLVADPQKAKDKLGWQAKTKFDDLVRIMVEADLKDIENLTR